MASPLFPMGGPEKWREVVKEKAALEREKVRLDPYRPVKGQVGTVPIELWPAWLVRYNREVVAVRETEEGVVFVVREREAVNENVV